ncbi:hypothetical protein Cni_G16191 [Canna indica]|uniref:DUF3741 domain-containing protein n=1 Tax=Canna indica TaxID=4628 RepID=A0AAQ3KEY3_9LILI|nr:hypothetical protein Cni_G16191 [Canna indica]
MSSYSSNKSYGTPIKMLIAKEMSKEAESKRKSLSIVAQLMGIDDMNIDGKHMPISTKRKLQEDYPSTTLAVELKGCHQQEVISINKPTPCVLQQYVYDKMEFRDAFKALQKPSRASIIKDQWGNCNEEPNENSRKVFVHKKLMDRKRPLEEERLKSKELQDALEVLSTNKNLFLKLLRDPDSIMPKHIRNIHMTPFQERHIAVLKPTKRFEKKSEKVAREEKYLLVNKNGSETIKKSCNKHHCSSGFTESKAENFTQPTRIVVLKPSTRMPNDMKAKVTPPTTLCKLLGRSGFFGDSGDSEGLESRIVEKKKSQQELKTVSCHQKDESLHSLVNSKRCTEKSSFSKSETDNIEEDGGSYSDLEILTPNSRRSWGNGKRTGSPCSFLTFSQASNSPNLSVVMEAKKQLLEKWASVASNENIQQFRTPRCSFSLGEMLAIKAVKEEENGDKFNVLSSLSCDREVEPELSTSCKTFSKIKIVEKESSLGNLSRSKSLPISISSYDHIGLSGVTSNFLINKSAGTKEVAKSKNDKSSFKEKISSFFFLKNKKTSREKFVSPLSAECIDNDESNSVSLAVNKYVESVNDPCSNFPMRSPEVNYEEVPGYATTPTSVTVVTKNSSIFIEKSNSCKKLGDEIGFRTYENSKGSQDQPSPTSVLDATFEDGTNDNVSQSSEANAGPHALSRASPIESVARSLSWDNIHLDMSSPDVSILNKESSKVEINEEDHFVFVQKLHSSDLGKSSTISAGCHSLQSHLHSVLLSEFLDWKEGESQFKEKRSRPDLLFNSTNSTLVEAGSTSSTTLQSAYPSTREFDRAVSDVVDSSVVSAEVWGLVKDSFLAETKWATSAGCTRSIMVDMPLMVGGYRLSNYSLEVQEITERISGDVLKDLIREAFPDINA